MTATGFKIQGAADISVDSLRKAQTFLAAYYTRDEVEEAAVTIDAHGVPVLTFVVREESGETHKALLPLASE